MAKASACVYSWCTVACPVLVTAMPKLCFQHWSSGRVRSCSHPSISKATMMISTGENTSFRLLFMTIMSVFVSSEGKARFFSKCSNIMRTLIFYAGLPEGKE